MTKHSDDIEAYAAYLNDRPRAQEEFDDEALSEFEEDYRRAEAAMMDSYYGVST